MKFASVSKILVACAALLVASSAFASSKASLQLTSPANVNGTNLKAGDYKLQWDGNGPNVEVSVMQGKKVVAKIPARIVELPTPADYNAAVTKNGSDGSSTLQGVRFQGKKYALDLSNAGDGMPASQ